MTPRTNLRWLPLGAWFLVLLASRLLVLFTEGQWIYQHDELYAGALALEMAAGRGLPLALTAHTPYCGGPILVAIAARAGFEALGPSAAALRLFSILFTTGAAVTLLAIVNRALGRRAMTFAGLLMLFPPPYYGRLAVLAWGNHAESAFPGGLCLAAIAALTVRDGALSGGRLATPTRAAIGLAFGAGLAGGFALFFSYAAVVYLITAVVVLVALGRTARLAPVLLTLLAGAAVGAVPTLLLNLARRIPGVVSLWGMALPDPRRVPRRVLSLFGFELRAYLAPHGDFPPIVELAPWLITLFALVLVVLRSARATRPGSRLPAEILLLMPVAGFLATACVSSFPIGPRTLGFFGYRYFAAVTPPLLAVVGVTLARLEPRLGIPLLLAILLPAALVTARRLPDASAYALRTSGASYYAYGVHAYETLDYRLEPALRVATAIAEDGDRDAAVRGVAWADAVNRLSRTDAAVSGTGLAAHLRDIDRTTGAEADRFRERLAYVLAPPGRLNLDDAGFNAAITPLSEATAGEGAERLAAVFILARAATSGTDDLARAIATLPPVLQASGRRGRGMALARATDEKRTSSPPPFATSDDAYGFAFERTRTRLVGRDPRPLPAAAGADSTAFAEGVEAALRAFEPEDPVRRSQLRRRLSEPGRRRPE